MNRALFALGVAGTLAAIGPLNSAIALDLTAVSEVRLGVLAHDQGIFSSHDEPGVGINGEVLFQDLGWLGRTAALRPHLGVTVNTAGATSQTYFGITGTVPLSQWGFVEGSFGGSIHNGNLDKNEANRKDLGCRVLFRESVSVGVYLDEHSSVAAVADHISNASICDRNEGLEAVGIRYGYRF